MYAVITIPKLNRAVGDRYILELKHRFTFAANPYGASIMGYPEGTIFYYKCISTKKVKKSYGAKLAFICMSPWILIEINKPCGILFR